MSSSSIQITPRTVPVAFEQALLAQGLAPIDARIYAARGIASSQELEAEFKHLLPVSQLRGAQDAAILLADAIEAQARILIVADYDADGATACAVAVRGLRAMGALCDFIVPNRFEYGYGLTPEIVDLAAQQSPDLIVTVDNGIASVAGVARAAQLGIEVLVTDHHLPGDQLPEALIVNPNQPDCQFASKALAGVGVMFYVLLALRSEMREREAFAASKEPNLADLLDLVALGTVADVAKLDANNRILVEQGLRRMRAGRAQPGLLALFTVAGRQARQASAFDLGFTLGPRLNAAGRLDDMRLGIDCLLCDDPDAAMTMARELDQLNRERRNIEADMQDVALQKLGAITPDGQYSLTVFDPDFHQGVVGLVASRLKERHHRPTIVFALGQNGEVKGSGRSIAGLHLRDALDLVSKRAPELIAKFGGHAMAAGLTLHGPQDIALFRALFESVCQQLLDAQQLKRAIEVDGELPAADLTLDLAERLARQVWGQGFDAPRFVGRFKVRQQKVVGEKHLKLELELGGQIYAAMRFQSAEPLPDVIEAVYQLNINEWQGRRTLQLLLEHVRLC